MCHSMRLSLVVMGCLLACTMPAAAQCRDDAAKVGWLGIVSLDSLNVNIGHRAGGAYVWFRREPRIKGIYPKGPAAGKLAKGDVITRVDGKLVTSQEGSRLLVAPLPGKPVMVTIRRENREGEVAVQITPEAVCPEDRPEFWEPPSPPPAPPPPAAIEAPAAPQPPVAVVAPLAPQASEAPTPPQAPPLPPPVPATRAWFGFGFECGNCGWHNDRFFFRSDPVVYSVDPGGPAFKAGLRRGDVLTKINNVPLTADEGSELFFNIDPGEQVTLHYRTGGEGPEKSVRLEAGAWSRQVRWNWNYKKSIGEETREVVDRILDEIVGTQHDEKFAEKINKEVMRQVRELVDAQIAAARNIDPSESNLRFAGTLSDVDIEVRGWGPAEVTVDESTGSISIRVLGSLIRLTKSTTDKDPKPRQ